MHGDARSQRFKSRYCRPPSAVPLATATAPPHGPPGPLQQALGPPQWVMCFFTPPHPHPTLHWWNLTQNRRGHPTQVEIGLPGHRHLNHQHWPGADFVERARLLQLGPRHVHARQRTRPRDVSAGRGRGGTDGRVPVSSRACTTSRSSPCSVFDFDAAFHNTNLPKSLKHHPNYHKCKLIPGTCQLLDAPAASMISRSLPLHPSCRPVTDIRWVTPLLQNWPS